MSYAMKYAAGNIDAGFDTLFMPRKTRGANKAPVILLHGANQPGVPSYAWEAYGPAWPNMHLLAAALADEGIPVIAGYMGGNTFASDAISGTAATSYINKALAYVAAQAAPYGGCRADKANLIGASMGAACAIRYASLNPTKAASVVGFIPAVSLQHLYTDNPNAAGDATSFTSLIATAHGLTKRTVTDASTTSGTATLTSASAAFTAADVGRQVVRGYTQPGIQPNTKIQSVTDASHAVMDKAATATAAGVTVTIAAPLVMAGTAGFDLIGVHAPRLQANGINSRLYYASDDPYIYPADVTAFAAAAGGTAFNAGLGGHDDDVVAYARNRAGANHADLLTYLKSHAS